MAFQYSSHGMTWGIGEVPMCTMCEERVATRETVHSGLILCDNQDCWNNYITQETWAIEREELEEKDANVRSPA
jgi:hypothetical protein